MEDLNNKVFLITGAASGIGAGVTKAVLEKGAKHVAILDINSKVGVDLESEMNAKYGPKKTKFIKCDITTSDLDSAYEQVLQNFQTIDVVINNAGIMNDSFRAYVREIDINVTALVRSSLKALNLMRKDKNGKGGTIINISSVVGISQTSVLPVYSATKSAVLQFSNCLGLEYHYNRTGVRVLTVCFGQTDTNLIRLSDFCIDEETNETARAILQKIPCQSVDSAVNGLISAFERGSSGSTWLVTSDKAAEDITCRVKKAYEILSEGIFEKKT